MLFFFFFFVFLSSKEFTSGTEILSRSTLEQTCQPNSEVGKPELWCPNCFLQSKAGQVVTQIESVVVGMIWFTNRVIKFYMEMPVKVTRSLSKRPYSRKLPEWLWSIEEINWTILPILSLQTYGMSSHDVHVNNSHICEPNIIMGIQTSFNNSKNETVFCSEAYELSQIDYVFCYIRKGVWAQMLDILSSHSISWSNKTYYLSL